MMRLAFFARRCAKEEGVVELTEVLLRRTWKGENMLHYSWAFKQRFV